MRRPAPRIEMVKRFRTKSFLNWLSAFEAYMLFFSVMAESDSKWKIVTQYPAALHGSFILEWVFIGKWGIPERRPCRERFGWTDRTAFRVGCVWGLGIQGSRLESATSELRRRNAAGV